MGQFISQVYHALLNQFFFFFFPPQTTTIFLNSNLIFIQTRLKMAGTLAGAELGKLKSTQSILTTQALMDSIWHDTPEK